MEHSIYSANKELRAYGGHFLTGAYSPARRAPALPVIPARASAHPEALVKIRPRYPRIAETAVGGDITRVPTMPQSRAIWEYETPHYAAASSVSTLTLAITDTALAIIQPSRQPAMLPQETVEQPRLAPRYSIVERLRTHDIEEFDTVPPLLTLPLKNKCVPSKRWSSIVHPIDGLRWWLVHPGRLEFLLWLLGTMLLLCVTVLFTLLLLSNLGYLTFH